MTKRICWKKGMRLTDDIFKMSDKYTGDLVGKAIILSTAGRFGLFPSVRPFKLSVDIDNDIIDVAALDCLGVTRGGMLIDAQYDTNYTNSFDTRATIPSSDENIKYLLCIISDDEWRDTGDGVCEQIYKFNLIEENSQVPFNSLPIARIVFDEYCWRVDDLDFAPPCLFVTSLDKYKELADKFKSILSKLDMILPQKFVTEKKDALKIFWPTVQHLHIEMEQECDVMTPIELLANVQKFVSSFVCACVLDEYINLGDPENFVSYIRNPYNFKNVYKKLKEGMSLCDSINIKIENFDGGVKEPERIEIPSPTIDVSQLRQTIKCGNAKIQIRNNAPGATVYYTLDGSTPTNSSLSGTTITIQSGFADNWHKEPPKTVTIKVIAIKDGESSDIETFEAHIRKGNPFEGRKI